MAKLITNQNQFLKEIIEKLLPGCGNLYFLIGYFYFSGFEQIYKNLDDKNIKILVGLDIEKSVMNLIKEYEIKMQINQSRQTQKINYLRALTQIINDTEFFDTPDKKESFLLFYNKIKDGTLEIRKTAKPNHAKMYLFEHKEENNQGGLQPGTMITGSSNLSYSGLQKQHEINVILYDEYVKGKKIFDELWETAIIIADNDHIEDFNSEVTEKIWIDKLFKPYYFYLRVLYEYFLIETDEELALPEEITEGKFINLLYQTDAIKEVIEKIKIHNGVLIADVVGLGKSIIASAVAHNLRKKVVIICPPQINKQWDELYRPMFGVNAVVFNSGSIHKAIDMVENTWGNPQILVIVDEAHKYRNENTRDYMLLHRLCMGNKVMLLTATPFNNRPQDIFAMISLFQIPSKSTIRTVDNLSMQFRELVKEYKDINKDRQKKKATHKELEYRITELSKKIRNILEPVTIRRSRIDLENIKKYKDDIESRGFKSAKVEPPKLMQYDLGDMTGIYLNTLKVISDEETGLIGARYKPVLYLKDFKRFRKKMEEEGQDLELFEVTQINLAKFMKRLLVARFESSIAAFRSSLDSMISSMNTVKDYYERLKRVPIYKKGTLPEVPDILSNLDDDEQIDLANYTFENELKKHIEKGLVFIPIEELRDDEKLSFIRDLKYDIKLLEDIKDEWFSEGIKKDPQLDNFIKNINKKLEENPKRKIVVFSQYVDTAHYLYENVKDALRVFYYSSKEASEKNKKIIKQNFDATSENQDNDYDVIISTDTLSEGLNLNRADIVINFDIPYNPTKVIQRVGRINRIGKQLYDTLFIYNYFPTYIGENEIHIQEITTLKKAMINHLLGEDTKVLHPDEELKAYFHEQYNKAKEEFEKESWDTKYRQLVDAVPKEHIDKALKIPHRSKIKRTQKKEKEGVIVFGKKGDGFSFRLGIDKEKSIALSPEDAFKLFEASMNEEADSISKSFYDKYEVAKDNLFITRTNATISPHTGKAINILSKLKELIPTKKDYLEDFIFTAKNLRSLPEGVYKYIRGLDLRKPEKALEKLIELIPQSYLDKIIDTAKRIEEEPETLILAEELMK